MSMRIVEVAKKAADDVKSNHEREMKGIPPIYSYMKLTAAGIMACLGYYGTGYYLYSDSLPEALAWPIALSSLHWLAAVAAFLLSLLMAGMFSIMASQFLTQIVRPAFSDPVALVLAPFAYAGAIMAFSVVSTVLGSIMLILWPFVIIGALIEMSNSSGN
ncbi:MAG: hypothetical protein D6698_12440 [Gammaproteobacteria bacterium]|nr:MAG: hypothetical protein D6698_12440 [Gammaproteobacteria bacterium]